MALAIARLLEELSIAKAAHKYRGFADYFQKTAVVYFKNVWFISQYVQTVRVLHR